jgi:hypothetical protein
MLRSISRHLPALALFTMLHMYIHSIAHTYLHWIAHTYIESHIHTLNRTYIHWIAHTYIESHMYVHTLNRTATVSSCLASKSTQFRCREKMKRASCKNRVARLILLKLTETGKIYQITIKYTKSQSYNFWIYSYNASIVVG